MGEQRHRTGQIIDFGHLNRRAATYFLAAAPYFLKNRVAQDENGNWLTDAPNLGEAIEFANAFLVDPNVSYPEAFVLDVGITEGRGWGVIEANAAFSSGIYGCDPAKALEVIRRSVRRG